MANFTEIKTGGWNDEDTLDGDQLSEIQNNMLKTPNFSEGSEHTPTGQVRVLGAEGMYIETLEVGTLVVGTMEQGPSQPLVRAVVTFPATHTISQGNVILAVPNSPTDSNLDLLPTGAVQGDWVRVTCEQSDTGRLAMTNNGAAFVPNAIMETGDQLTFTYFTSGGWRRC